MYKIARKNLFTDRRRQCSQIKEDNVHRQKTIMFTDRRRQCSQIEDDNVYRQKTTMFTDRRRQFINSKFERLYLGTHTIHICICSCKSFYLFPRQITAISYNINIVGVDSYFLKSLCNLMVCDISKRIQSLNKVHDIWLQRYKENIIKNKQFPSVTKV